MVFNWPVNHPNFDRPLRGVDLHGLSKEGWKWLRHLCVKVGCASFTEGGIVKPKATSIL